MHKIEECTGKSNYAEHKTEIMQISESGHKEAEPIREIASFNGQ
jgi:hypothetical protein